MSDPLIRACENYIVIEPGKQEKFLNAEETLIWLESWLDRLENLPDDLRSISCRASAAQHLIDTACELEISPGFTLQWFAVRLEPRGH